MPGDLDLALRVRADVAGARRSVDQLRGSVDKLSTAASPRGERRVNRLGAAWERTRGRMARVARAAASLRGAIAGAVAVTVIAGITRTGLEFERLERALTFARGSAEHGAAAMAFVRAEADRLGIALIPSAQGFSALAAAARGTALEGEKTREIFRGVAEASSVLGLTAEQTGGALTAIEQIISKSVVSAEELRGQLGERIPGAFQIAARAMGVTTSELDKMLVSGELLADDFLPRFAAELRRTFAADVPEAAQSSEAAFNRLGTAIAELENAVARSGLVDFLADLARNATELANLLSGAGIGGGEGERTSVERRLDQVRAVRDSLNPFGTGPLVPAGRVAEIDREIAGLARQAAEHTLGAVREAIAELEARSAALTAERTPGNAYSTQLEQRRIAARLEILRADEAILEVRRRQEAASSGAEPFPDVGGDGADAQAARIAQQEILNALIREENEARREAADRERERAAESRQRRQDLADAIAAEDEADRERTARHREDLADAIAAEDERLQAHEDATRAIQAQEDALDLGSQYDRAIAAARDWRDQTLDALDDTADNYEELRDRTYDVFNAMALAAGASAREQERRMRGAAGGMEQALRDVAKESENTFDQARDFVVGTFGKMEAASAEFARTGKVDAKSLVDSILADFARLATRRAITGPLANALIGEEGGGGLLGDIFGALFHSGGVAGAGGARRQRQVPALAFAGAPRYHRGGAAGLRDNEIPAILTRGETVRTPEQERALGRAVNVEVNINDRGSGRRDYQVERSFSAADRREIITIVATDTAEGGDTARATSGRFGLARPARS